MAVWAGFDNPSRKLGGGFRYGGTMCAPIWGRVMADAARRATPADSAFALPSDVAMMPLCRESGMLAGEHCPVQDMYPSTSCACRANATSITTSCRKNSRDASPAIIAVTFQHRDPSPRAS
jgi:membrane carboxypeptidase/penicillin-binding protein